MKVSDYIATFLARQHITHTFVVSGGAAVHMIDSVGMHPKLTYICSQHEQHAGAEADGYARISNNFGVAIVTSGPGATNLATSIANAYYDSIPILLLCGQVSTFRLKASPKLRQKGFQETDIVGMYTPITKYATRLLDPAKIRYELEKGVYIATTGRKGPVVLDIPDDLSRANIDEKSLESFSPRHKEVAKPTSDNIRTFYNLLGQSEKPILIFGAGIGLSDARGEAYDFAKRVGIPVVHTWGGADILDSSLPTHIGAVGVCGPRATGFAVQKSDLVIVIGTRLSQLVTGKPILFAPRAKKVMVDIDPEELTKFHTNEIIFDLKINSDAKEFFRVAKSTSYENTSKKYKEWLTTIYKWDTRYPMCPKSYYKSKKQIEPHVFITELMKKTKPGAIIASDTGANLSWTLQTWKLKKDQRIISAWSHTPMGYSLPGAIGATFASGKEVICLIGDGGLMMCLQELQTVVFHKLPIKIFIFNNHGHSIQKQTMDTWLESRYCAVNEESGLSFPDFEKIGKAFGIPTITLKKHTSLGKKLSLILERKGAMLINVEIDPDAKINPMLTFGSGLEDLSPKLPREELEKIMNI